MTEPRIIDLTFIEDEQRRVQVTGNMALVYDGQANSGVHWRWDHICNTIDDSVEGRVTKRVASYLSPGHEIVSDNPLTIKGSLLCVDCRRHGWVRDGTWMDA